LHFELELVGTTFWILLTLKSASFEILCLLTLGGIVAEEECTFPESAELEELNVAGGVEEMGTALPPASCSLAGSQAGNVTAQPGNLLSSSEGTVSVSSE
jgi:hypothetical protein